MSDNDTIYASAGWIHRHIGIRESKLHRLVTRQIVRVVNPPASFTRYSVYDVREWLAQQPDAPPKDAKRHAKPLTK